MSILASLLNLNKFIQIIKTKKKGMTGSIWGLSHKRCCALENIAMTNRCFMIEDVVLEEVVEGAKVVVVRDQ